MSIGPVRRAFRRGDTGPREEVDAELRFHLEGRIEELMQKGMSRKDAEEEARRRFGDRERIGAELEVIATATHRQQAARERWAAVVRDFRFALRGMLAKPGYTAVVVLTLALAIGANTAIYSAVQSVLLRPLPVSKLDRLVALRVDLPKLELFDTQLSAEDVLDISKRRDIFDGVTGIWASNVTLTGRGEPRRIAIAKTMGDFSVVFDARPVIGRFYDAGASQPGSHRVVVLSHGAWQQMFAGDPNVVGSSVVLNDSLYQVVGVMPREFRYPRTADAWSPFPLSESALSPNRRWSLIMTAIARVRDGITPDQLRGQIRGEMKRWKERFPERSYDDESSYRMRAVPFVEYISGQLRPVLLVLLGAVTVVLLIACANVGSLQLVRTTGRSREIAVRAALGAGRWPIVRQFLVESLALALLGGIVGIAIGTVALRALARWEGTHYEALRAVKLDGMVLIFAGAVSLAAGLIFGVVPAWRASRVSAQEVLRGSGRGASIGAGRHRFLQSAVVVQLALTLVLMLGSGVLVRSLSRMLATDPGFRATDALTMQIAPPSTRYTWAQRPVLYRQIVERLARIPGIDAVALTSTVPFSDMLLDSSPFTIPGAPPLPDGQSRHANAIAVSPEFFRAIGVTLMRGRPFTDVDREDAPKVVVVDEQLAKQYFPTSDPIGQTINHFGPGLTIVGVVRSVNQRELGAPYKATIYYPYAQMPFSWVGIVVHSTTPSVSLIPAVRNAVREIDPELPVYDIRPLSDRVEKSLGARRLAVTVLGGFAALALTLALLGTYGVLSYSTSQRTRELGIRMALGARPGDVVAMVLRSGLTLAAAGLVVGIVAYLGIGGRVLRALVYEVSPSDPATMAIGFSVLAATALVACWIPARRASSVDPAVTLRAE